MEHAAGALRVTVILTLLIALPTFALLGDPVDVLSRLAAAQLPWDSTAYGQARASETAHLGAPPQSETAEPCALPKARAASSTTDTVHVSHVQPAAVLKPLDHDKAPVAIATATPAVTPLVQSAATAATPPPAYAEHTTCKERVLRQPIYRPLDEDRASLTVRRVTAVNTVATSTAQEPPRRHATSKTPLVR